MVDKDVAVEEDRIRTKVKRTKILKHQEAMEEVDLKTILKCMTNLKFNVITAKNMLIINLTVEKS